MASSPAASPSRFPFFRSRRQTVVSPCNLEKALSVLRFLSVARHCAHLPRPVVPVLSLQKEVAISHSSHPQLCRKFNRRGCPGFQDWLPVASKRRDAKLDELLRVR
jgi:hypothetical protein